MKKMALHGPVAAGGVRASHQASWRVRACARGYGRRAQSPHTALPPHTALCTSAVLTLPLPSRLTAPCSCSAPPATPWMRPTTHVRALQGATRGGTGRSGCARQGGLRFCSMMVFTAAFQASGDSIHPLGIRSDCSPPRPELAQRARAHTHIATEHCRGPLRARRGEALRRALCSAQGVQGCRRVRVPTAGHPCRAPPRTHGAAHPAALRVPARPAHARRGADSQRRLLCFLGPSLSDDACSWRKA